MPLPPALSTEEQIALGVTPPQNGEQDRDPKPKATKLKTLQSGIFRRALKLSDDKAKKVKETLKKVWEEWDENTSQLRNKLRRSNDLLEGIKEPKDFPWKGCSNLHVPIIEIHITILHSVVSSTMLDNDPIAYVKILTDGVAESVDADLEKFLNWTCKIKLKIDATLSDIYWNTYRDGTAIGDLDWVEEYDRQFDILRVTELDEFQKQFPTPESLGVTLDKYNEFQNQIISDGEVQLKVEETVVRYRGPKLRVVELKDFVMVPTASPSMDYALFVGDAFVQRADFFRRMVQVEWFDKDEVKKMLEKSGLTQAPDSGTQAQDQIEGIGRNRRTKPDEYYCIQGILKINLSDKEDEPEQVYLVTYEKETNSLLRIEEYPYWHNRCKYIAWRFKKRPNRFLGQSIYDQLIDLNEEIDTQHNQRVDSRTISTVPSFKKLDGTDFDPTRNDQKFYPGVTFTVRSMKDLEQFAITQTDMGQSMQEEQNLMYLADLRTGASQLRSGQSNKSDPRAPAKKIQLQIQQSGIRVDDHMRELKIATAECLSQILELYYQFSPETITYSTKDPQTGQFIQREIARQKLRNRNMVIEVARTTIMDNPSALVQKALTIYEILSKEPLIATNIFRRRELVHRLLIALREPNIEKICPTVDEILQELRAQAPLNGPAASGPEQNLGSSLMNSGSGGGPSHNARNGEQPSRAMQTNSQSVGD